MGGRGIAVVCKTEDTTLGRHVALNFLHKQLSQNRQALERFQRHIPLFRIFDDEVKRSVRVEKQLSLFKRGERPVALIDGGIDEHAGRQIAFG